MYHLNQITRLLEPDVKQFASTWMTQHQFSYLNFARIYHDGSCVILSNDNRINEYLFENESPLFCPVENEFQKNRFFYLIPKDGKYNKVMHDADTQFNLKSAIDLFERHQHYIDALCIGADKHESYSQNVFINNLDAIESFKHAITNQFSNVLSAKSSNYKSMLTTAMRPNIPATQNDKIKLTQRELDCISCLKKGYTVKETAEFLSISPRTVEVYYNNLRVKFGCKRKRELIKACN